MNILFIILDSSMAEHSAVNRGVVGSSPTRGVIRLLGQAVKTSPFHGGNPSSNLGRVTKEPLVLVALIFWTLSSVG